MRCTSKPCGAAASATSGKPTGQTRAGVFHQSETLQRTVRDREPKAQRRPLAPHRRRARAHAGRGGRGPSRAASRARRVRGRPPGAASRSGPLSAGLRWEPAAPPATDHNRGKPPGKSPPRGCSEHPKSALAARAGPSAGPVEIPAGLRSIDNFLGALWPVRGCGCRGAGRVEVCDAPAHTGARASGTSESDMRAGARLRRSCCSSASPQFSWS